jgi:hypothetical protein
MNPTHWPTATNKGIWLLKFFIEGSKIRPSDKGALAGLRPCHRANPPLRTRSARSVQPVAAPWPLVMHRISNASSIHNVF